MPRYRVVDQPFFDNVELHRVGSEVEWNGPPGACLVPAGTTRPSSTEIRVFPDALAGRAPPGGAVGTAGPGDAVAGTPLPPAVPDTDEA